MRRISVGPSEYVIHYRRGRIKREGYHLSFWFYPSMDNVVIIPTTVSQVAFQADQVTKENQGVEIAGLAVWRVADPLKAAKRFSFDDPGRALQEIGQSLKDIVESAVRHTVSNMTIEDALRRRGSIILKLKEELAYLCEAWGLEIDTLEIKSVIILSKSLFENMQADFRNQMHMASESSRLEAERVIAERGMAHQEALAVERMEHRRRQLEREEELALRELEKDQRIERGRVERQLELLEARRTLAKGELDLALQGARGAKEVALEGAEARLREIQAENEAHPMRLLCQALPDIASKVTISELRLGDDPLTDAIKALRKGFEK